MVRVYVSHRVTKPPFRHRSNSAFLFPSQSQAGWLQHDYGHLSVCKTSSWNHVLHKFVIGHLKVGYWTMVGHLTILFL